MRPTSRLPSLTLTFRSAETTAFWIFATAMFAAVVGLVSAAFGMPWPWAWGALALCLPLPGFVWPVWFEFGIRAWNKGARQFSAVLRAYVLKVCYYVLFGAVGRTGSLLDVTLHSNASRWMAKPAPTRGIVDRSGAVRHGWWGRELMAFAREPGHRWALCLLPVLLLLLLLGDDEQESAPPSSTYTLY